MRDFGETHSEARLALVRAGHPVPRIRREKPKPVFTDPGDRPRVLVGECTGRVWDELSTLGWGRMWIARDRRIYVDPGEPWALDNGAFRDWKKRRPFDHDLYQRVLYCKAQPASRAAHPPLFVVSPDIPAGGNESLRMSIEASRLWPDGCEPYTCGYVPPEWPRYLVVQDGMDPIELECLLEPLGERDYADDDMPLPEWGAGGPASFDGLFLGGTDRFKGTADVWLGIARRCGLRFHYGRCGTLKKLERAMELGVDSLDSAFPLWRRDRLDAFVGLWQQGRARQMELPF